MKRILLLLSIAAAALTLCVAAGASTITDVQALGYQVGVARTYNDGGCTVYYISGYGVGIYADSCNADYQATIDSLANPAAQCNRAWQSQHPDQLAAFSQIVGLGYSISGDQCADRYTVTSPGGATIYSGPGDGLAGVVASLTDPGAIVTALAAPSGNGAPATCLPLCPDGIEPQTTDIPASATVDTGPVAQVSQPVVAKTAAAAAKSAVEAVSAAAPKASSTAVNVTHTVTGADVNYAATHPDGTSQNPLLAAALQSAFDRDVVIGSVTRCSIGTKRVSCRYLFGQLDGSTVVHMTIYGTKAQTITLR